MMDLLKENKMLAGLVIGATLLVGAYFAFFSGGGSSTLLSSNSGSSETSKISQELLVTIGDLKAIDLDTKIFSDPAYQSLVDFHIDIPLQPIGRDNPFAPLVGGTRSDAPSGIPGR